MMPLFERLKEMVFRNTNRARKNGFFSEVTLEELEKLQNEGVKYNVPVTGNDNKMEE